ncbi:MAG: type secretion outer membrane protein TolC family [Acidobacteria bacterium]|nr:type secretion outer membrane protein TolC family [Acidobacteriota bacterium]
MILAALLPLAAFGQTPATPLTLREALDRALTVNNTIDRSRAEIGVAEANKKYLLSAILPRISANGAATRNSTEVTFGDGADARTILAQNDWNYRVVLTQPIYAGNRERRAYDQAKLGIENAREGVEMTEDAVLLRVASNYLAVVQADERIGIERRNIELAEKRRTQAQAFYQAGESTKVDTLRADTAIKAAQRQLALAEQIRENAVSRLRADLEIEGNINVTRPPAIASHPPEEPSLLTRASERPDVRQAENSERVAKLEVQKQRGFWLPTVSFEGGWVNQKQNFPVDKYSYGRLNFNVPIFQSGEVQARVAQARERELQAHLDLENARTEAREDVRRATVDLHAAETSLGLAKEQLAAAEAEYQQEFELYRAQEATSLDVSSSETSLAEARRAVAEETLNRDLAELRVWYAAGALKDAVGATPAADTKTEQGTR